MLTKQIFRRSVALAAVLALSVGMLPSLSIAEGAAAYEQPELNPHIKSVIEADGYRFIDLNGNGTREDCADAASDVSAPL